MAQHQRHPPSHKG